MELKYFGKIIKTKRLLEIKLTFEGQNERIGISYRNHVLASFQCVTATASRHFEYAFIALINCFFKFNNFCGRYIKPSLQAIM